MNVIIFFKPLTEHQVGYWRQEPDGTLTASPGVADILDVTLTRTSATEAWAQYASWSNGYLASIEADPSELTDKPWADPDPDTKYRGLAGVYVQRASGHWEPEG